MTLSPPYPDMNWRYRDLPIIGSHISNIGKIVRLWNNPCAPTPEIWVQAAFHAIPTLLWTLTKPDSVDLRERFFGRGHRRRRNWRFRAVAVDRADRYNPPEPRWVLWRVFQFTQRVGWYLLVADATENFAINWMTTAYMWSGCEVEPTFGWQISTQDTPWPGDNGNWRTSFAWTGTDGWVQNCAITPNWVVQPLANGTVMAMANVTGRYRDIVNYRNNITATRILHVNSGTVLAEQTSPGVTADGRRNFTPFGTRWLAGQNQQYALQYRTAQPEGITEVTGNWSGLVYREWGLDPDP